MKPIQAFQFIALFFLLNISCVQHSSFQGKLEKVWEFSDGLDIPESAHYNPHDQCIYISNIVGEHNIKDGQGYITKISAEGKLIEKKWLEGLNAPKGIYCSPTKLYVCDIDEVLEVSLSSGEIVKSYQNSKSVGFNDVTVTADGKVYITDSGGDCIFTLGRDSLEVFLQSEQIQGMNGIYWDKNRLLIGAQDNFLSIDLKTKTINNLISPVGYLDGIEKVAEKKFVTTDWKGHVQLIEEGGSIQTLLDTSGENINAADLGFIPAENTVLIPTFIDNRVIAYKLK